MLGVLGHGGGVLGVLFGIKDLTGQLFDERQRLAPFVAHQTHGRLVDDAVEDHQEVVLERLVAAHQVVPQVVVQFQPLLAHVRKIDEEPRTPKRSPLRVRPSVVLPFYWI